MSTETDTQLVSAADAARLIAEGALLVDVRSDAGRNSTGAIPGALVGNRERVDQDFGPDSPELLPEVEAAGRNIVVFCGSVNGSRPVAEKLKVLGYANAVHVDGGFPALREAGVPTTGPTDPGAQSPAG